MLRFALIDDDISIRKQLKMFINAYCEDHHKEYIIGEYGDGMDFISQYKPKFDIVLMDIEMNILDGLKTAKKLRELDEKTILIFITRMAQFAVKGYDVDALGFMIKPIVYSDFKMMLIKAERKLSVQSDESVIISLGATKKIIQAKDIYFIESMKHEITFHTNNGQVKCYGTMKEYSEQLTNSHFAFCSQSYYVNLQYVSDLRKNEIVVHDTVLIMARPKKKSFQNALLEYYGGK